MKAETKRE